jgi:DNA-binding MarR family transcriptional regulator
MTDATDERRTINLVGAFALAAADRIQVSAGAAVARPSTDTAALLLMTTTLEGSTQDALARALGLTQSGATRLVDRLVSQGLIRRDPGPNRRTVALSTTRAGRVAAIAGLQAREQACADLLDPLTVAERRTLSRLLDKVLRPLPATLPGAHRICRLCDPEACGHEHGRCPVTQGLDAARAQPVRPTEAHRGTSASGTARPGRRR